MYIVDFRFGWATPRDQCHSGASITSKALIGHPSAQSEINTHMVMSHKKEIRKMGNTFEAQLIGTDLKIAVVVGRFNEFITSKLLDGALDGLKRHGVDENAIDVAWVPGAFEVPFIAKQLAETKKYDAIIGLGTVIRGSTTHYDYVCNESAKGIANVSLTTNVPVIFGIVTTENIEQAIERAGTKSGNKGYDAAMSAIEMANLKKMIG